MKYIKKGEEPAELVAWKATDKMYKRGNYKWKRFRPDHKVPVHAALCEEQGWICCYCGIGIDLASSHIEHFRPREFFQDHMFEYDNLLCSCQRELQKEEPRHCGNAKGSWFDDDITISPLDPDCGTQFTYNETGHIGATGNDHGAEETISHLNLDDSKLVELRKAAIGAAIDSLETFQEDEIQETIEAFSRKSPVTNSFQPFCMAIVQVLTGLSFCHE